MFNKLKQKKEQKKEYRFKKTVDGGDSFTLYNYLGETVFTANLSETKQNGYTYIFNDLRKNKKTLHEISHRERISDSGIQKSTFEFDGVDIRERLSQLEISLRVTQITDKITDFHILQGEKDFAFARMERSEDKSKRINISKKSGSENMLFFVFFAISKLY